MPDASFKKLDTNEDGRISQAEAAADSTIVFSSADTNGDGYLDSAEWKASSKSDRHKPQSPQSMPSGEPGGIRRSDTAPPTDTPPPDTETPRQ